MKTRFRVLSEARGWQSYGSFARQYRKIASQLDPDRPSDPPARATHHRWLNGNVSRLPVNDHCQVLEAMFEGWSAPQLFECWTDADEAVHASSDTTADNGTEGIFAAVAAGLSPTAPASSERSWGMPQAASPPEEALYIPNPTLGADDEIVQRIGAKLIALTHVLRLSTEESQKLASLAGATVDLDLRIGLEIAADGDVEIEYRHDILNMTREPISQWTRDIWFKHYDGQPLRITPTEATSGRQVTINRLHDAMSLSKFTLQFSPPIQPGESVAHGFRCKGGRFVDEHFWQQSMWRHVRHYTLTVRDWRANRLKACTASEIHQVGETSTGEGLMWTRDDDSVTITLTRNHLQPNDQIEVRWEL